MPDRKLKDIVANQSLVHAFVSDSVTDTVRRMQAAHVGTALIFDGPVLKGIFTRKDLLDCILDASRDPKTTHVGEVMTPNPVCLHCDEHGIDSVRAMREHNIRHVVVTNVGEKGYGIVSVRDFPDEEIGDYEAEMIRENLLWEEM
ncbi:MAG: CBS domain-containing protein [Rhodospirillales bacterium]